MNPNPPARLREPIHHDFSRLRTSANALLGLAIVLIVLGSAMIAAPMAASLGTMLFLSAILLVAGGGQILGAFWVRHWSGFFLQLLIGILYLTLGVLSFERPFQLEAALTLLIAASLIVGAAFRIGVAFSIRFEGWIWPLINGLISLALGIMIWRQWPFSGLYVIGLFLGIELVLQGWSWMVFSLMLKRLSRAHTDS